MSIKNILLDLDGTLTDPKEGITKSIQYALIKLSQVPPSSAALEWAIGPPLFEIFENLLNTKDPLMVKQAVNFYRERYEHFCHIENKPYQGIQKTLENLKAFGCQLYLATSKLRDYAQKILSHFELDLYFSGIHGSELDGTRDYKETLIRYILDLYQLEKSDSLMIGDRDYDILGAQRNQIRSIAVTYGYGSLAEIEAAKPDAICHQHEDLLKIVSTWR